MKTFIKLIALFICTSTSAFAGYFSFNLTADGRYVVEITQIKDSYQVVLLNDIGTWNTTNPRLQSAFKVGLRVNIDGIDYVPHLQAGSPVRDTTGFTKKVIVRMFDKSLATYFPATSDGGRVLGAKPLTSYDIRGFANDEFYFQSFRPVTRIDSIQARRFKTDLHTHFAGYLPFKTMMEIGIKNHVPYPVDLLKKLGILFPAAKVSGGKIDIADLVASTEFDLSEGMAKLEDAMIIEKSYIRTFLNMEERYVFRGPIAKYLPAFADMLRATAELAGQSGIQYMEQSISNILDPEWLKVAHAELPKNEAKTGVKIRFLAGFWRHSDPEWNADEVTRLKFISRYTPYIVGGDFMGHETNPSSALKAQIEAVADLKNYFGDGWQTRVHSGENPLNPANVREGVEYGANRIGHGLYIEKDPVALVQNPHTEDIDPKVLQKLKDSGTVIELNPPSNQALNNLSGGISTVHNQFRQFKAWGIPVVTGSDGVGMYGADHFEIRAMLKQIGFNSEDLEYIVSSEIKYRELQNRSFEIRSAEIARERLQIPTRAEMEAYVDQQGRQYTPELEARRKQERMERLQKIKDDFAKKGILPYEGNEGDFEGKLALDISGGSQSQFNTMAKEGRMAELMVPEIEKNFQVLMGIHPTEHLTGGVALDPNKTFFLDGGTQFGVEAIEHLQVQKYNATHSKGFKIVGVMPEEVLSEDVKGPAEGGITHYIIGGKTWADFQLYKLEILQKHGGAKVAIAGKMFVADEFRFILNSNPHFKVFYHDGPVGASTDLSRSIPNGAYKNAHQWADKLGDAFFTVKPDCNELAHVQP